MSDSEEFDIGLETNDGAPDAAPDVAANNGAAQNAAPDDVAPQNAAPDDVAAQNGEHAEPELKTQQRPEWVDIVGGATKYITNIKSRDLTSKIKDPAIVELLPSRLLQEEFTCQLNDDAGIPAVANAIRRTIMVELPVKRMCFEYEDFETNHPTTGEILIREMIISRFRMIPIDQTTPLDAKFELFVENKTKTTIDVKSGQLKITAPGKVTAAEIPMGDIVMRPVKVLPCDSNITLFTLEPGHWARISNIYILQKNGYENGCGGHTITSTARIRPLDVVQPNIYDPVPNAVSTTCSDPRISQLTFSTNGEMPPRNIIKFACDEIISRVKYVQSQIDQIISNGRDHILTLSENDTIGTLFTKLSIELFPDISVFAATKDSTIHQIIMKFRCDDPKLLMNTICDHAIKLFGDIRRE